MNADEVWEAATERISTASGELYHSIADFPWWENRLSDMTEKRGRSFNAGRVSAAN
jgi:hypothetical protein